MLAIIYQLYRLINIYVGVRNSAWTAEIRCCLFLLTLYYVACFKCIYRNIVPGEILQVKIYEKQIYEKSYTWRWHVLELRFTIRVNAKTYTCVSIGRRHSRDCRSDLSADRSCSNSTFKDIVIVNTLLLINFYH